MKYPFNLSLPIKGQGHSRSRSFSCKLI